MATVVIMQVQIDDRIINQIQKHTSITLTAKDREYFVQWLAEVGLLAVNSALRQHPDMTFGQFHMVTLHFIRQESH